tara:strand:+ start:465 stop:611 length:147 start_codon:yes stop_codon:yes gene_type:complete
MLCAVSLRGGSNGRRALRASISLLLPLLHAHLAAAAGALYSQLAMLFS